MTTQPPTSPSNNEMNAQNNNRADSSSSWFARLLLAVGVLVIVCFVLLYIAMGTRGGSEFILQKIAAETNVSFKYGQGTLRHGMMIHDVVIAKDEPISIYVDSAAVKMGYRALFARQVHLIDANINTITVVNKNPPTNEPFEYKTLSLPVDLLLENSTINTIRYEQATKTPVVLSDITAGKISWQDSAIDIKDGTIGVNTDSDSGVSVRAINGKIDLTGDYPLNLSAQVSVNALQKAHFEPLLIQAKGTLRRTTGSIEGLYNQAKISGEFIVQGVDDNSPFWADVHFDELTLPYANAQNIRLSEGNISAMGVLSAIDLRMNTKLVAKDIPNGRYKARATVNASGASIERLTLNNDNGDLLAQGSIDWQNGVQIESVIDSDNYQARTLVPTDYTKYQNYLPKTLQGQLNVRLDLMDDKSVYDIALHQKDGERIHATILQPMGENGAVYPYKIKADWQNYTRTDLPDIGELSSSLGQADVTIFEHKTDVKAAASIEKLLSLPSGQYEADASLQQDDVTIRAAKYAGQLGQINADGMVYLANNTRPLSWKINGNVGQLKPNVYFNDPNKTPISTMQGTFSATGRQRRRDKLDEYDVTIDGVDMTATLKDGQGVSVVGKGQVLVRLLGGDVNYLASQFAGKLKTTGIHEALGDNDVALDVAGNLNDLKVNHLDITTQAGRVQATGKLLLKQTLGWDLSAAVQDFDPSVVGKQVQPNIRLAGSVITKGSINNGAIHASADVDAVIRHDDYEDNLTANIVAAGNKYTINEMTYSGAAGQLSAAGWVDMARGVVADVSASVKDFDAGVFIKDRPSQLTGDIKANVDWQNDEQLINISHLDVAGVMNDEPVFAKGSLYARMDLPSSLGDFMTQLRKQGQKNFDLDSILQTGLTGDVMNDLSSLRAGLGELQDSAQAHNEQLRRVIKELKVDNVNLRFGSNHLSANGNHNELAINMDIKSLSQLFPTIRGQIAGGLIVSSHEQSLPTIYSDLSISNVSMPKIAVARLNILGKLVNFGNAPSSLVATGLNVVAFNQSFKSLRLDLQGTQGNHDIRLLANNGEMQVNARTQGGFDGKRYQAVISEGRLQTRFGVLNQERPAELKYTVNNKHLQVAPHCWQTVSATKYSKGERGLLCLTEALSVGNGFGDVALKIDNIDTTVLTPLLPSDLSWRSKLFGEAKLSWADNKAPDVQAILYSQDGTIGLRSDIQTETTLPYKRISIIAKSEPKGLRLRTDVNIGQSGGGYADVVIDPYSEQKSIAGALVMDELNLAVLRPFFPAMQTLRGKINVAGGLGGTLQRPLFFGNASIYDGAIALADVPIAFDDLSLVATIKGTQASVEGEFSSGTGTGDITGDIEWQSVPTAKFTVKGDKLVISSPPLLSATISPHLEILTRPTQKFVDIKGVVSVPSAVIRPPEATSNVTAESPDVVVIDRRMTGNVANILRQVVPWTINADIGVDLGDSVLFRGFGARLPLSGAIRLSQSGQGSLQGRGMVFVNERSSVDFIGQNLELNYAQIRFNGNALSNPSLSIEAVREIEGQTVGVRVTGTVNEPIIATFNDAGLSEQQAMNALVTGSLNEGSTQVSEQDFKNQVNNTLAAAGLSLGLQGTRNLTNQLGEALGLQSLTLDASGNSTDAHVNVTGYISPDLYIRYGVGVFNAQSTLSMRYQLTRRVYVEATSGIEKAVDVVYRWRW